MEEDVLPEWTLRRPDSSEYTEEGDVQRKKKKKTKEKEMKQQSQKISTLSEISQR